MTRTEGRLRRKMKIKKTIRGTEVKPRIFVVKSNRYLEVGLVNDESGKVLKSMKVEGKNAVVAEKLGKDFGKALKGLKVETVVFDRSGYRYHGVIKTLADGIRSEGIQF